MSSLQGLGCSVRRHAGAASMASARIFRPRGPPPPACDTLQEHRIPNSEISLGSHADGRGRRCNSLVPSARLARFPWPEQTPAVEDDRQPCSTLSQDTRDQVTGNLTRTCLPQTAAGAETWKETCVPAVFFLVLGCVSRPMKGLGERAGGWGGGSQALFSTSLDVCLFPNKCVL